MEHFVITIARGYGSGGKQIAIKLSERLGIEYYDRDLIRMVSEETGINEALFNQMDESHKPGFFKRLFGSADKKTLDPSHDDYTSKDNLFNLQADMIRRIAAKDESSIIVGRCAHHILKDEPHVVKVFIYADMDTCMKNVAMVNGMEGDEARDMIIKTDKERAEYHKYFTNTEWNDARNYDVCVNTSKLNFDQCVEIIVNYLETVKALRAEERAKAREEQA